MATNRKSLTLSAMALILATAGHGETGGQMPKGSFLRRPVQSRAQFIAQIKDDVVVAARYRRHFGVEVSQLLRYMAALRVKALCLTKGYLVWHVDTNGVIGARRLILKQGTPVFVDPSGVPAFEVACGNPMLSGSRIKAWLNGGHRPESILPIPPGKTTPPMVGAPKPTVPGAIEPPETSEIPAVEPPLLVTPGVLIPSDPMLEATPPGLSPSAPQVFGPPSGGIGWWPILTLPIVGVVISHPISGGGSSVPEPGSVVGLAVAVGVLAARRAKKINK